MKALLPCLATLAVLSACSKNNSNTSTQAQNQTPSCPTLNGKYSLPNGMSSDSPLTIYTQVINGQYQYALNGSDAYIAADGQTHTDGSMSALVTCGSNSVDFLIKQSGQADVDMRLTDIGNNQVRMNIGGNGANVVLSRVGGDDHAAQPAPQPVPAPNSAGCPVLNGNYVQSASDGDSSESVSINIQTHQQGNSFSYGLDSDVVPADGQLHSVQGGQARISCDHGSLDVYSAQNGQQPQNVTLTPVGQNELRMTTNGVSLLLHRQ